MGVPAFFRWLTRKYPSVVVHCVEQKSVNIDGQRIPLDALEPNPNGVEFDNLYLDMNGIIHPCTHPEDRPAPRTEDDMMVAIFDCIDRLFNIVRPRKVLYMAIDGVAPRAKMNQQRSRRFRAAKESVEKVLEVSRIRSELLEKGINLPAEKAPSEHFDSNCITPGTPFMARLADCLHYYVHERLNNNPAWRGIKVILSDANVPGEGEHKIMDYIRRQRAQPDHDPNTQHCLCGADADLIMLGLATHEPNFTIIREEFKPNKPKPCDICGQIGHELKDCIGSAAPNPDDNDAQTIYAETDYIFVRLNVLREYLERDLQMPNLPFNYDFERVVDDWVFMCFFVGNDFLPHLPSLEIREGAIDRLVNLYKDCVYKTGGFLTHSGDVNLERVQMIMNELGKVEDHIFKNRQQKELQFKAREKAKRRRSDGYNQFRPNWNLVRDTQFAPKLLGQTAPVVNARQEAYQIRKAGMHSSATAGPSSSSNSTGHYSHSRSSLEAMMTPANEDTSNRGERRKFDQMSGRNNDRDNNNSESDDDVNDEVRLWEDGFKDRYYESKFDVGSENIEFRYNVALHYVKGLCWVLRYYYQGCASWKWYFPYHYAPFASDFVNISGLGTDFEKNTEPFKPLEQLMGVFPAASCKHVPAPWATLMSDPESPIIDFYPEDFKIDLNGKKFAWQGVALLPFVEETRLFNALKPYYEKLSSEEMRRNVRGDDRLYVTQKNIGYELLHNLYVQKVPNTTETAISIEGVSGTVLLAEDCVHIGNMLRSPVIGLDDITGNGVCTVRYRDPKYPAGFMFPAVRLSGAIEPPRVLKPGDLDEEASRNWRAQIGMAPATQRATLSSVGHRMLDHYTPKHTPSGSYSHAPPPSNFDSRNNYRSASGNRGGYSSYDDRRNYNQPPQRSFNRNSSYNDNNSYYNQYSQQRNYQSGQYQGHDRNDQQRYHHQNNYQQRSGNRYNNQDNQHNRYSSSDGRNSNYNSNYYNNRR